MTPEENRALDAIYDAITTLSEDNAELKEIWGRIIRGSTRYNDALNYAGSRGTILSEAIMREVTAEELTPGMAENVLRPLLEANRADIIDAAKRIQGNINRVNGVKLDAVNPEADDMIENLLQKLLSYENREDAMWLLDEPLKTQSRIFVDNTLKANAAAWDGVGIVPVIKRRAESNCCKWCKNLGTIYGKGVPYKGVDKEIFRRHQRCKCSIELTRGKRTEQTQNWRGLDQKEVSRNRHNFQRRIKYQAEKEAKKAEKRRLEIPKV